jgi:hypothetical protein
MGNAEAIDGSPLTHARAATTHSKTLMLLRHALRTMVRPAPIAFVCLVIVQVIASLDLLRDDLLELADFASNSMLVTDAKQGVLCHGIYSRIGFYHPGPVTLYFQALGEIVVYDWLKLVQCPFAGQACGLFVQHALLLALTLHCLVLILGRVGNAVACFLVLLGLNVSLYPDNLASSWTPHISAAAFLTFVAAWVATRHERWRALPAFAYASVVLVHGHICFALFVGFATVSLAVRLVRTARTFHPERSSGKAWALACASLIVVAGVLPIIVHTAQHFPGEIGRYFEYQPDVSRHTFGEAWLHVLFYALHSTVYPQQVGVSVVAAVILTLALVAAVARPASAEWAPFAASIAIVFSLVTAISLLYARYRVDDLVDHYTMIYWSSAVMVLLLGAFGSALCRLVARRGGHVATVLLAIYVAYSWPKMSVYSVPTATLRPVTVAIAEVARTGPVVLHADVSSSGRVTTWIYLSAVINDLERQGVEFCVSADSWNFSYHPRTKCSHADTDHASQLYFGLHASAPAGCTALARHDELVLARIEGR